MVPWTGIFAVSNSKRYKMKKAFLIIGIIIAMTGCGIVDTQQAKTEDTSNYDTLSVFNYNIETESL